MAIDLSNKRFTRGEVELIVRRAAELQQGAPYGERIPEGASLTDIAAIAAELGIPPDQVKKAALELQQPKAKGRRGKVQLHRVVPRAITEQGFERLVLAIQREMDDVGAASVIGKTLTWTSSKPTPEARRSIIVSSGEDGTTALMLEIDASPLAGILGGVAGAGSAGVVGLGLLSLSHHSLGLGALAAALVVGTAMVSRSTWKWLLAREVRQGDAVLDRLAGLIDPP